jgi:hypothetical protein
VGNYNPKYGLRVDEKSLMKPSKEMRRNLMMLQKKKK